MNNLLGEFVEEKFSETGNASVFIDDADGQFADLTFNLDHVIENEVG